MELLPDIKPNYDVILQNIETLKWQDLILDDKDIFEFLTEIYTTNITLDLGEIPNPSRYQKYGKDYIDSLKIGSGSYGQIYSYKDKIIKFYNPMQGGYCSSEGIPISIISEENKTILENDLLESVSAIYFNKLIENYSPCHYNIYGSYILMLSLEEVRKGNLWKDFFYIEDYNKYYGDYLVTMAEKLSVIPNTMFHKNLYYILYVVLHNIYIGQTSSKFVHGDLHMWNIMYKPYKEKTIRLTYVDEIIEINNTYNFIPIIIDFGFSSFNIDKIRYVALTEPITVSGTAFDTYFDSTKLFSSLMNFYRHHKFDPSELEDIFLENKAPNIDEYLIEPEVYRISHIYSKYKPRFITDILNRLLNKLDYKVIKTHTSLPKLIDTYADVVYFSGDSFNINSFITYNNIKYKCKTIPHFTEAKYSSTLNIHMLTIDNYMNGHKFVTQCCKRNIYDFIIDNDGIVCINGSYFDMETKGNLFNNKYINKYMREKVVKDIKKYMDDYGYMNIINNTIDIKDKSSKLDNEIVSGPLLFLNGIRTNLEEKILEKYHDDSEDYYDKYDNHIVYENEKYKYSCTNKKEDDINYDKNFTKCDNIEPGELYHIGNPNPRTILATKDNLTYFIVIEGRSLQYRGASIEQMYEFLSSLKIDNAINLDGGDSSGMIWKSNGIIYSPHKKIAPKTVGSVIGII